MTGQVHTFIILLFVSLVACTPQSSEISIDSDANSLEPAVSPNDIEALAQLADEATLVLGEQVYNTNCASCHGINGEGQFPDAPMQPDETGRIGAPPHNGNGHTWHHDDDLLYEMVENGGMGNPEMFYPMPAFGDQLSEAEIFAAIAYIKTMWSEEQRMMQAQRTLLVREQNQ